MKGPRTRLIAMVSLLVVTLLALADCAAGGVMTTAAPVSPSVTPSPGAAPSRTTAANPLRTSTLAATASPSPAPTRRPPSPTPSATAMPTATSWPTPAGPTATPMPTLIPLTLPAPLPLEGERPPELAEGIAFLGTLPAHHICGPAWSPDGTLLAYGYWGTNWYAAEVLRPADGVLLSRWLGSYSLGDYWLAPDAYWTPDGAQLLFVAAGRTPGSDCEGAILTLARPTDPEWRVLVSCSKPSYLWGGQWVDERTLLLWSSCGSDCGSTLFFDLATNTWDNTWRGLQSGHVGYLEEAFLLSDDRLWTAGVSYAVAPQATIGLTDRWHERRPLVAGSSDNAAPQFWTGHELAFLAYPPGERRTWPERYTEDLYLRNVDSGDTILLARGVQDDRYGAAFLDPTGTRLALTMAGPPRLSQDGVLVAEPGMPHLALLSWPERQLLGACPVDALLDSVARIGCPLPRWSPDGSLLAFQPSAGSLAWMDRDGHSGPILRPLAGREIRWMGWGAEGRLALVVDKIGVLSSDRRLWLLGIPPHPVLPASNEQRDMSMPAMD